jgi:hypothetical protein
LSDGSTRRSDWLGGLTGILVFLGGVALLLFTFKLAFDMFSIPPADVLKVSPKDPVNLGQTAESFVQVVQRILLLLVMAAVGSLIANRGIKLYAESRRHSSPKQPRQVAEPEKRVETV